TLTLWSGIRGPRGVHPGKIGYVHHFSKPQWSIDLPGPAPCPQTRNKLDVARTFSQEPVSMKRLSLLAAGLLLSAAPLFAADAEDAAIKAVEDLGGDVFHEDNDPAKPVVHVDMGAQAKDADLKILAAFKRLKELVLTGSQVTDA